MRFTGFAITVQMVLVIVGPLQEIEIKENVSFES